MPHGPLPSPVKKNERLLIFFPFWGMWAPKNVVRKFHWGQITNMAVLVVSAVGWLWAAGEFHRGLTAYTEPAAPVRLYSLAQIISHFYTPPFQAFHGNPPLLQHEWKQTNRNHHGEFSPFRHLHEGPARRLDLFQALILIQMETCLNRGDTLHPFPLWDPVLFINSKKDDWKAEQKILNTSFDT